MAGTEGPLPFCRSSDLHKRECAEEGTRHRRVCRPSRPRLRSRKGFRDRREEAGNQRVEVKRHFTVKVGNLDYILSCNVFYSVDLLYQQHRGEGGREEAEGGGREEAEGGGQEADGKWGFACCHQFVRNSYCTGAAAAAASTDSRVRLGEVSPAVGRVLHRRLERDARLKFVRVFVIFSGNTPNIVYKVTR